MNEFIKFDISENKIWIVSHDNPLTRSLLANAKSVDKVMIEPCRCNVECLAAHRDGHDFLFNSIKYTGSPPKNLQIIGIGEVVFYSEDKGKMISIMNENISFQNITFETYN